MSNKEVYIVFMYTFTALDHAIDDSVMESTEILKVFDDQTKASNYVNNVKTKLDKLGLHIDGDCSKKGDDWTKTPMIDGEHKIYPRGARVYLSTHSICDEVKVEYFSADMNKFAEDAELAGFTVNYGDERPSVFNLNHEGLQRLIRSTTVNLTWFERGKNKYDALPTASINNS